MAEKVYKDADDGTIYLDSNNDGKDDLTKVSIPGTALEMFREGKTSTYTGGTYANPAPDTQTAPRDGEVPVVQEITGKNFDPESALTQAESEVGTEKGVNSSGYLPGQWNPSTPIKIRVPNPQPDINQQPSRATALEYTAVPRGTLEEAGYLAADKDVQDMALRATQSWNGSNRTTPAQINGVYKEAIGIAAAQGITLQEALAYLMRAGNGAGGSGSGTGGGPRAFTNVTKTISLTDPGDAERTINAALATALGRRASADEVKEFVTALNSNEKLNPTTTTAKGVTSKSGTTQTQIQEPGFDAANFAENWARGRKGAAEYQAATTYMDSFSKVINELEF